MFRGAIHRWTPEQARAASLKAVEAKRLSNDNHPKSRLIRVRKQLDLLDGLLESQAVKPTLDAQCLDRLASALARLSEQERQLAGRPMPGSLRPRAAKDERRRGSKSDLSDA